VPVDGEDAGILFNDYFAAGVHAEGADLVVEGLGVVDEFGFIGGVGYLPEDRCRQFDPHPDVHRTGIGFEPQSRCLAFHPACPGATRTQHHKAAAEFASLSQPDAANLPCLDQELFHPAAATHFNPPFQRVAQAAQHLPAVVGADVPNAHGEQFEIGQAGAVPQVFELRRDPTKDFGRCSVCHPELVRLAQQLEQAASFTQLPQ